MPSHPKNCSDADGQIFEADGNGETYQKGWLIICLLANGFAYGNRL